MNAVRAAACLAALLLAGECYAQTYPSRSVRIVVPYPAGGPTDVMARLVAQKLSEALGQQFYVENHGGAAGTIGTVAVANAPADGYTLLFVAPDFVVQPAVRAKAPFDPVRSFAPVTVLAASPEMIAVAPTVPAKNLQELIAFLRANPGKHRKLADIQDRLKKLGFEPVGSTPDEFAAKIKADTDQWAKIVRQANIKIE